MILFEKKPGWRVLELGCGANPHPLADVKVDVRSVPGVTDFVVDLDRPEWPEIGSSDFDIVLAIFVLEHLSWRTVPNAVREIFRILKPGGKALLLIPNTEKQIQWIGERGWEKGIKNDGDFIEASRILMGDNDYKENQHRSYFSPTIVSKLFSEAGFSDITMTPFGAIQTDLYVEAKKPLAATPIPLTPPSTPPPSTPPGSRPSIFNVVINEPTQIPGQLIPKSPETPKQEAPKQGVPTPSFIIPATLPTTSSKVIKQPEEIFNRDYFNNYQGNSFYWDFPYHEGLARHLLSKSPRSALELGAARGYLVKRLEDAGISVKGIDISKHAFYTRVSDSLLVHDLLQIPWPVASKEFDLVYSVNLFEYIPEDCVAPFMQEMDRVGTRGFHLVTVEGGETSQDKARTTLKPLKWWQDRLPNGHQVVDSREISSIPLHEDYIKGDGKLKLNIGCAFTMFHQEWRNIDVIDGDNFAKAFQYKFLRHDVKNGLPFSTTTVDLIQLHHVLEHFTYEEGLRLLRECRRVVRSDGAMRITVPSLEVLAGSYFGGQKSRFPELGVFDECNEGSAKATTQAAKLYALLAEGHKSYYDQETLEQQLKDSGWLPKLASFRKTGVPALKQLLRETTEMPYGPSEGGISLFVDATPALG